MARLAIAAAELPPWRSKAVKPRIEVMTHGHHKHSQEASSDHPSRRPSFLPPLGGVIWGRPGRCGSGYVLAGVIQAA